MATLFSRLQAQIGILAVVLMFAPRAAFAQRASGQWLVDPSDVEFTVGITINSLSRDVNASPFCTATGRPCTNDKPSDFGGFGLDAALAFNRSETLAIVAGGDLHTHYWTSGLPKTDLKAEDNTTRAIFVGPRVNSIWKTHGRSDPDPSRFFAQALVGFSASNATSGRPIVQVGGGVDSLLIGRSRTGGNFTLRMEADYRFAGGSNSDLGGYRFLFGLVFGPRLR